MKFGPTPRINIHIDNYYPLKYRRPVIFLIPFGVKMNKNFKVIFNRARGLLVVANECARCVGKSKSIVTSASAVAMCAFGGGIFIFD